MSSLLQELKRNSELALWHDYRLGHAQDLSGNANHGTPINGPQWDRNGVNFEHLSNQAIRVDHDASLDLTALTAFALIIPRRIKQFSNIYIFQKWEATPGNAYGMTWRESNAGVDDVWCNASAPAIWNNASRESSGVQCISFDVESGGSSSLLYYDGLFEDTTTAPTIVTNTSRLFIGNLYLLTLGMGRTLSALVLVNKRLTATEHRDVYLELIK